MQNREHQTMWRDYAITEELADLGSKVKILEEGYVNIQVSLTRIETQTKTHMKWAIPILAATLIGVLILALTLLVTVIVK